MIKFNGLLLLLGFILSSAFAALPVAVDGVMLPSLAPMLDKTTPAVVNIATRSKTRRQYRLPLSNDSLFRRFFNLPDIESVQETQNLGSGVIVDARKGYVLTNNHVIKGAYEITVTLADGRELQAEILGRDADTDIAVIRIEAASLTDIPFADSSLLRVGDFVVAIGNPFGLGQTVTSGIVSALGRSGLGIESFEDFIQTDASINLGNSGGALVNLRGELVGINTAIFGSGGNQGNIGIGFAIPINMAKDIMLQLVEFGEVKRSRFGAQGQDLTAQLAQAFDITLNNGFVVTQIESGSSAYAAGVAVGDVIVAANGKPIRSAADMHNLVGLLRIGQPIKLELFRNGRIMKLSTVVQEIKIPTMDGARLNEKLQGATIGEIRESSLQRGQITFLKVIEVEPGSNAWNTGLRVNDILYSLNKQYINNFEEIDAALNRIQSGMLLNIRRGDQEMYLLVK